MQRRGDRAAGAFQVFSIRGVSGQRVLTRVAGAPLYGERRAGVETSLLDPLLVGTVEVVRGPSGTYQGSGALAGVVEVFPRRRDGWGAELGWTSQGDEGSAAVGWGGGPWTFRPTAPSPPSAPAPRPASPAAA